MVEWGTMDKIIGGFLLLTSSLVILVGAQSEAWILTPRGGINMLFGFYLMARGSKSQSLEDRAATTVANASADRSLHK